MGLLDFFKKNDSHDVDKLEFDEGFEETFLSDYYFARKPLVIKKGTSSWEKFNAWSKESLIKNYGRYECTIVSDSRPASSKKRTA